MQNTYANEAFLDELAAADPVEFRLRYIAADDHRGREVPERVAHLASWQARPSPQRCREGEILRGRGVS